MEEEGGGVGKEAYINYLVGMEGRGVQGLNRGRVTGGKGEGS